MTTREVWRPKLPSIWRVVVEEEEEEAGEEEVAGEEEAAGEEEDFNLYSYM